MTGGFLSQAELKDTGTFGSFLLGRGSLSQKPGTQGTEIGVDGGLLFPPKYMARPKWTPIPAAQAVLQVGWKSGWGYPKQGGASLLSQVQ